MAILLTESDLNTDDARAAMVVDSVIQRSSQIATLPGIAVQIIQLCEDPDSTIEELNAVIDTVLAMRLLKLVNSAYYGMSGQITSLQHAIVLLGLKAVKNVAIATSLVKLVRGGHIASGFDATELWTHSIAVATGARMLARETKLASPEEAFLAGLLHDMGIVVEMQACGANFVKVIQRVQQDQTITFRQAEIELLGASHESFGAGLCRSWHFPKRLEYATGYHHRPWELPPEDRVLASFIHVADIFAARSGQGYVRTVETDEIDSRVLDDLKMTEEKLLRLFERLPDEMLESQQLLSDHTESASQ